MQAVLHEGRPYGVPWFIVAGLLYYREDLLARHGLAPPRTWDELSSAVRTVRAAEPDLHGFVWQLAVNARSRHPEAAERLVAHLTSAAAQKALALALALAYGLHPTRRELYRDADLLAAQLHLAALEQVFEQARPRPVTPRYVAISQAMQSAFSAAITGIETPQAALDNANARIGEILAGGR